MIWRSLIASIALIMVAMSADARAESLPLTQYIYPIDCLFETTYSGVGEPRYSLTPEECFQDPEVEEVYTDATSESEVAPRKNDSHPGVYVDLLPTEKIQDSLFTDGNIMMPIVADSRLDDRASQPDQGLRGALVAMVIVSTSLAAVLAIRWYRARR